MSRNPIEEISHDILHLSLMRQAIIKASAISRISQAVIGAIISRETNAEPLLCAPPPVGHLGDFGRGCGPMQIDVGSEPAWCEDWKRGKYTTADGIMKGCEMLSQKRSSIHSMLPSLVGDNQMHAVIAAYNCGQGNVRRAYNAKLDLDHFTAGGDYSKDVLSRAVWLSASGWGKVWL